LKLTVCVLGVVTLLAVARLAGAQDKAVALGSPEVAGFSPQQQREFDQWLEAERAWRAWMAEHRNAAYRNWMGMDSRDWMGRPTERKPRPVAPAWLDAYCGALPPDSPDPDASCQQYEQLKTYDFVAETIRQEIAQAKPEQETHTRFALKHHWGFGLGYDNQMVHGSVGMQVTVAEWGRWNYGVLGASLGFIRRSAVDSRTNRSYAKSDASLFITIASASYRIKYVPSLGMHWYVDFAQIYDMTHNMPVSQFGFSVAKK